MADSDPLVMKTSAVRVSTAENDLIYRSLAEVPPELREQLQRAIEGPDSRTILIADQKGREKILQAVRGLPPEMQRRVMTGLGIRQQPRPPRLSPALRIGLGVLVAAALLAALFWLWIR